VSVDWDRELLAGKLAAVEAEIAALERSAAQLRTWLAPAEAAYEAYRAELRRLDQQICDLRSGVGRRTATEAEQAAHAALEGRHQRCQDAFREWCWAAEATFTDRTRMGPPRSWSMRDADALRTSLVAVVDDLALHDIERDRLLAELRALDTPPAEADVPGSRPWLQRMLGT
jgi:septal ring factor EnvC (AmiA/AmiB activator)